MNESRKRMIRGVLCTVIGSIFWGFSGTCGQYLFTNYEISSMWLTCVRLLSSGIILCLMALPKHKQAMVDIWKDRHDSILLVVFAIFGPTLCQYGYMTGISYANAATITMLQTLNLVIIMIIVCLQTRRKPDLRDRIALVLAMVGTYLLVTGGDPRHMVISTGGLVWGLIQAGAVTCYTLLPRSLLPKWGRPTVMGWAMLIGGVVINVFARSWTMQVSLPWQGWLAMAAIILLGTVAAFSLFLQGVADIGAVKASMLTVLEPLSATFFSAVWLGTRFSATDLIGFACILAIMFLLANEE